MTMPLTTPTRPLPDADAPGAPAYWTRDDLVHVPPNAWHRFQLVRGELLVSPSSPSDRHQAVLGRLFHTVHGYVEQLGSLRAYISPSDLSWGDRDSLVQPDLFVVPIDEARARGWLAKRRLKLVIEVLSPSTARYDRFQKRVLYLDKGVELLWLVDIERAQVEIWTPADRERPRLERERVVWQPDPAQSPLFIELPALFAGL